MVSFRFLVFIEYLPSLSGVRRHLSGPRSVGCLCFIDNCQPRFSVLRQPGQIRAFFRYRGGLSRKAYLRRRAVVTRSWHPNHQRFRLPDCLSRAGVRQPVRPRNRYRHLLRSNDVAFDFSVSLDHSLTSQSVRSQQVPPSNCQIIVQPKPAPPVSGFFHAHNRQ
jgi:hypothetical protein